MKFIFNYVGTSQLAQERHIKGKSVWEITMPDDKIIARSGRIHALNVLVPATQDMDSFRITVEEIDNGR